MGLFSGYDGKALNHLEVLYQRGERELAMDFFRLLGCTPVPTPQMNETGSTYICVHPDENDQDGMNNVLYLSEIREPQLKLEQAVRAAAEKDADLAAALARYRERARRLPYGIPHFGLRFPSFASIEPVLEALVSVSEPAMKDRVHVTTIRPDNEAALAQDLIQAFVYTDIVANGFFCFGQVIELQAQRAAGE